MRTRPAPSGAPFPVGRSNFFNDPPRNHLAFPPSAFSDHEIYKNAYRQSQHRNSQSYIASVIPPPVTHLRPPVPSGGLSFFHGLFCQSPSASFVHGYKSLPCSSFLVDLRKLSVYYDGVQSSQVSEKSTLFNFYSLNIVYLRSLCKHFLFTCVDFSVFHKTGEVFLCFMIGF